MTCARKDDCEKTRLDLIPYRAIEFLGKVMTFGASKYAPHNWRNGLPYSRLVAAMLRHAFAIARCEDYDAETGLPHAAHVMACAAMLLETDKKHDDRWKQIDE